MGGVSQTSEMEWRRIGSIRKEIAHPQFARIEVDFVSWRSPAAIALEYSRRDCAPLPFGLFPKRQRNVRAALERIIGRKTRTVTVSRD